LAAIFHRSPRWSEDAETLHGWRSTPHAATRLDLYDDASSFTEAERRAHCRRSLWATLITVAAVATLFALVFGLVAASGRL
jgi:hypothetical protein